MKDSCEEHRKEAVIMIIGEKIFQDKGHTYVMGILNITPDSFSDGGRFLQTDRALRRVEEMIEEGADIIDIGGESTRPGYTLLTDEEEIRRVRPVIEKVKSEFNVPISLDTYKPAVAKAGIEAGADLINDIWGLKYDPAMAEVIAQAGVSCCLMHNRREADYRNYLEDVLTDLRETLELAHRAGIPDERIMLDPGVGFGKTYENNLEILSHLDVLGTLGYPVLLGASRKSVIGNTLSLPVEERLEGTLATTVCAVLKGASYVRVHDIKENVRVIQMTEAIMSM